MITDTDTLLGLCQTEEETRIIKLVEKGIDLNDVGSVILRRVTARLPNNRKKLSDYNKVYSARKRRVEKGSWPDSAPTASECVDLGILDKANQYNTKSYVKAVDSWTAQGKPTPPKANSGFTFNVVNTDEDKPVIESKPDVVQVNKRAFAFTVVNTDDQANATITDDKAISDDKPSANQVAQYHKSRILWRITEVAEDLQALVSELDAIAGNLLEAISWCVDHQLQSVDR